MIKINTTLYLYTIEGNISLRRIGNMSIFYQLFASKLEMVCLI